jgi:hypothetical protein
MGNCIANKRNNKKHNKDNNIINNIHLNKCNTIKRSTDTLPKPITYRSHKYIKNNLNVQYSPIKRDNVCESNNTFDISKKSYLLYDTYKTSDISKIYSTTNIEKTPKYTTRKYSDNPFEFSEYPL